MSRSPASFLSGAETGRAWLRPALWLGALGLLATQAAAQVQLVTDAEARLPDANVPTTRAITRGPGVALNSAAEVAGKSFPLKIQFEPRGGAKLDPTSLKVEYLKTPAVDLTERLRPALKGDAIDLAQAALPPGAHRFRVSIKDQEGRSGNAIVEIKAR